MRYELAGRTLNATTAEVAAELRTTSSDKPKLLEVIALLVSAANTTLGLGIPAAIGIGPVSPVKFLASDPADPPSSCTLANQWATKPTVPTNFYRRWSIQSNLGNGFILAFPRGITIAVSSALVLWNIGAANALLDMSMAIDE